MNFIDKNIQNYADAHSDAETDLLQQLGRDTWAHVLAPRMLSGHFQGRVLSMLSRMIHPEQILEIGTYTGYSAICLAEGLTENGLLHTIEVNEELHEMIEHYVSESPFKNQIKLYTGDAKKIIPAMNVQFDLVFIDADKESYSVYYDLVFDKVRKGGYIIADNVLWSGNVIKPEQEWDDETEHVVNFNKKVQADSRVKNLLLPVRDGLMIVEKLV